MKTAALGMQHVLAMYAGAILVPLIVGGALGLTTEQLTYLVAIDIFMCGVATILQISSNRFFGIGLPVVLGCTFTAVGPMIAIGGEFGISAIYGAIIVSGIFVILISTVFGKLVRFFPPVVTGSVVTIIGLTLIPVAINDLAGGQGASDFGSSINLLLGFGTLTFIILMYRFSKGFIRSISIIIGLIAGTTVATVFGKVDFNAVMDASYFHMPQLLYFGRPTFEISAVITMCLVVMVSLVESTGVYFALSDITDKELTKEDLAKGYRAEGIAVLLGGIFNAFQYTAFSQNVGLVQLTGVTKRKVIFVAGMILVVFGLIPKFAALTTVIPTSVLGGAMLAMFGMVVSQGIKMLGKVINESPENSMIIACSVGMGLGVTVVPDLFSVLPTGIQILTNNGIVAGSVTAIALNIIFNMRPFFSKRPSSQPDQQLTEQEV
ncbi:purine permease [Virgibacillus sp. MSJ-26]|uniref:nucleobase:cation symporter-2 family protein n=1 Tax=Virgibacillus sp. MSJ-26 TaxID=2841522 RepID=UPI001C10339B|nr:nucleobase:cation symporter-2 family protein [Virgibacillus sp. MSJ-26]MBU5466236.1 purine permease [Virgibacillus sp. MSJ-26]